MWVSLSLSLYCNAVLVRLYLSCHFGSSLELNSVLLARKPLKRAKQKALHLQRPKERAQIPAL